MNPPLPLVDEIVWPVGDTLVPATRYRLSELDNQCVVAITEQIETYGGESGVSIYLVFQKGVVVAAGLFYENKENMEILPYVFSYLLEMVEDGGLKAVAKREFRDVLNRIKLLVQFLLVSDGKELYNVNATVAFYALKKYFIVTREEDMTLTIVKREG